MHADLQKLIINLTYYNAIYIYIYIYIHIDIDIDIDIYIYIYRYRYENKFWSVLQLVFPRNMVW